jgi:hypothetical protein
VRADTEGEMLVRFAALIGVLAKDLARPIQQPGRRLAARGRDHLQVEQQFVAAQSSGGAGFVGELGRQKIGHDVVGRMFGTPVDVGREHFTGRDDAVGILGHLPAALLAQRRVAVLDDMGLILLGNAEQHPDDLHRHLRAEVAHEVEPAGADQRVKTACGELADLRFQRGDLARREDP